MNELRRRDLPWRDDANCIGVDPEMFYPGPSPNLEKAAKKICSQCAVIDYAIKRGDSHGILGGLTGRERKIEAKRRENQAKSQARRNSYDQL